MSPKVPKAYLKARRDEILEAALKCFIEKGFHNTTMQDIYDATNLSPGAVYNYFSSKEDIVIGSLEDFIDWSISSLTSLISENPNEPFTKIFQFYLSNIKQDVISKGYSVQLEFYAEAARNTIIREAILKTHDITHIKLIKIIKNNQRAGVFNDSLDPLSIARAIMGMIFGIAIHKMLDPKVDLDAYGRVCEAMIDGTFSSPPKKHL